MKPFSLRALAIALCAAARLAWGTDEIFINTGNLSYNPGEAPQIDAKAFYNSGTFSVYTFPLPYDFQSVLSYTNRGTMVGSLGFQFDLASSSSKRA